MRTKRLLRTFACILAFVLGTCTLFAQNKVITGVVKDQTGLELAGATVTAKGTQIATTTEPNGSFKISVPEAVQILVITYVGATPKEFNIVGQSTLAATLEVADKNLGEVVVIGYGTAKKANLTTSQTAVTSAQMEKTINTTLEQALQGRSPGVYVTQNSGQPGGGISVNIRGLSSLSGTQPLYVIDGVQIQESNVSYGTTSTSNPLAGINPSDIEDMQILQGPSAAAIYGSRGTNGVILITTKRGKSGDVKVNYAFQYSMQMPPESLDVMNLPQYAQMVNEYHALAGGTTPQELLDPSLLGNGTDWQKELFNRAPLSKHQLSLSGGSNNTTTTFQVSTLNRKELQLVQVSIAPE